MDTARRLYLYTLAGVGLAALGVGLVTLLETLFVAIGPRALFGSDAPVRGQLSWAAALILVGSPVYALHWRAARRSDAARSSAIGGWYVSLVRLTTITVAAAAAVRLVEIVVGEASGARSSADRNVMMARFLVAWMVWLYHTRISLWDGARAELHGAAAWVPRLYRHTVAWVSLMVALFAMSSLIRTAWLILLGQPTLGSDGWWRGALWDLAPLVVWLSVWAIHRWEVDRAIAQQVTHDIDERASRIRGAYFGAILLWTAIVACGVTTLATSAFMARVVGVADLDPRASLEAIVGPLIWALPFLVAATLHHPRRIRELSAIGRDGVLETRRLAAHVISLVGLAFLAAGVIQSVALVAESVFGSPMLFAGVDGSSSHAFADASGPVVAGAAAWLPTWGWIVRSRARDPLGEARSTVTAVHLSLVVGAAVVLLVPPLAFIVYRAIDALLGGVAERPIAADLALPFAIVLVSGTVAAYHGRLFLRDRGLTSKAAPGHPIAREGGASILLVLTTVHDGDLPATLARLHAALGPNDSLQRVGEPTGDRSTGPEGSAAIAEGW